MLRPTNICVSEKNRGPRPEREEEYVDNIEMNIYRFAMNLCTSSEKRVLQMIIRKNEEYLQLFQRQTKNGTTAQVGRNKLWADNVILKACCVGLFVR